MNDQRNGHDRIDPADPTGETASALERYASANRALPSADFADRLMDRIEQEPIPGRGIGGRLRVPFAGLPAAWRRPAQVLALVLVIALGAGGALIGTELVGVMRNTASPSPSPSFVPSPTAQPATPTPTATPTPSPTPSVSPSPTPTPTPSLTPRPSQRSPGAEASASASETPGPSGTPEASDDHGGHGGSGGGGGSSSPSPSATPRPSATAGDSA